MQPDSPSFTAFFGDADRTFRLTPPLILELERVTNAGIGGLSRRMFAGDFSHKELLETVRLGLIGGGESPQSAASLTATYAAPLPITQLYAIALPVIETVMFGHVQKEGAE
jgi:hypothetical protein